MLIVIKLYLQIAIEKLHFSFNVYSQIMFTFMFC